MPFKCEVHSTSTYEGFTDPDEDLGSWTVDCFDSAFLLNWMRDFCKDIYAEQCEAISLFEDGMCLHEVVMNIVNIGEFPTLEEYGLAHNGNFPNYVFLIVYDHTKTVDEMLINLEIEFQNSSMTTWF